MAPLVTDVQLEAIGESYSDAMLTQDFFSHTDPNKCDLSCRYGAAGYEARAWAENLAQLDGYSESALRATAQEFLELWMSSGGHRKNILGERYTHTGIGIAADGERLYVTVEFSQPK